jgi:hypothetical protein
MINTSSFSLNFYVPNPSGMTTIQSQIEQEERRNGGQPKAAHGIFIVLLSRWIPGFLRSSVPLVQSSILLFYDFKKVSA